MGGHGEKQGSPVIVLLEPFVGDREFLGAFLNAVFQILGEFRQVSVGAGIVDRRGDMARDREQDVEVLFGTGLCASISADEAQNLIVALKRDEDKGHDADTSGEFENGGVHAMSHRIDIVDEHGLRMNEQFCNEGVSFLNRDGEIACGISNLLRDSGDLRDVGDVAVLMAKHQQHARQSQIGYEQLKHGVHQFVEVQGAGDCSARLMHRRQLADVPADRVHIGGNGHIAFVQSPGHEVEHMGQLADLIVRRGRKGGRHPSLRQLASDSSQALQRCGDAQGQKMGPQNAGADQQYRQD